MTPGAPPAWRWFGAWAGVGALLGFGFLALLSIGLLLLVLGAGLAVLLAVRRPASLSGASGLVAGPAVGAAFLAWTNRDGPGAVCRSTSESLSCTEEWSPWPFAGVAVLLLVLGLVPFLLARRSRTPS